MILALGIILWLLSGLLGSHLILSNPGTVLNWRNSKFMGIGMILAGPINLFAAFIFMFTFRE